MSPRLISAVPRELSANAWSSREVEILGDRQRLPTDPDRVVVVAGDHEVPSEVGLHGGELGRRWEAVRERHRPLDVGLRLLAHPAPPRQVADQELRLRGRVPLVRREEAVPRLGQLLRSRIAVEREGPAVAEQQRRALGIVRRPEVHRGRVCALGGGVRPEGVRPVARRSQREPGRALQRRRVQAGGSGQLERGPVVVGEQLRPVLQAIAAERPDPVGRLAVLLAPRAARDLSVRHVSDQEMEERVFGLSADRGTARPADEPPALQLVEPPLEIGSLAPADRGDRSDPERLAHHRGVLQQRLVRRGRVRRAERR